VARLLQMQWPRLNRRFAGIFHDFIVTFGRIGYADMPEWLPADERDDMERIAGKFGMFYVFSQGSDGLLKKLRGIY
jgi:hypothetical protein